MKRLSTLLILLAIGCMAMMAQGKLTPQARLQLARKTLNASHTYNNAGVRRANANGDGRMTLVVNTDGRDMAATVAEMRAAGAELCSRLGRQLVVSIPIDSIGRLERIAGIERIDKGHKGQMKTDVARRETGASLLNGPTKAEGATGYTGRGVTVCVIDAGFDFQHPAFKDAEGRSRIKCVYMMGDEGGNKFTTVDPELGEYTFPGSVYDTPELIATLTTDDAEETHGTHTAGIAAGSLSPQGFGGMAPEADLVLIPMNDVELEGDEDIDVDAYVELALAFADAYARKSQQPMVISMSANSHDGPHDGTGTVTKAIEAVSEHVIPVFSVGNEGAYPIHLYKKFTTAKPSVKTFLIAMMEDEDGKYQFLTMPSVTGYVRTGDELSIQLTLKSVNQFTGRLTSLWTSEKFTATPDCEEQLAVVMSDEDAKLGKYFDGTVALGAFQDENGRLGVAVVAEGGVKGFYLWELTVSGSDGTEVDLWDNLAGFGGVEFIGLSGYVDGDSDWSCGDWTTTERVVSVGAYCANDQQRDYDGTVTDTSKGGGDDEEDFVYTEGDIAVFSSYGTSLTGIAQPVVCAPGVNVVSSINHYTVDDGDCVDEMLWQDYPYSAESGTSMSCPVVAGIVALWLQAKPDLTLDDVKDVMSHTARTDDFTSADDMVRWGYGKIDAAAGISYILGTAPDGISETMNSELRTQNYYDLQGRRISVRPTQRGLYIVGGKKLFVR